MKTVEYTRGFTIAQAVDKLFPLFSPEGETHWVPGWEYENLMGTTELSEDYVFLTRSHDHGAADAIWIVKSFKPAAHSVVFYKVEPAQKLGVVTVRCQAIDNTTTEVEVSYKYSALSSSGVEFVDAFTEAAYADFIAEWERLLTAYFSASTANG